jgi:hypothetical protein
MNLFGQILPLVKLRFNSASTYATESVPMQGIKRFGPYDTGLFPQESIRCGIIYPSRVANQKTALVEGLLRGEGSIFGGFEQWFRTRISFEHDRGLPGENTGTLKQAASEAVQKNCDLVFVLTTQRSESLYQECKAILLGNGIPCQFVIAGKLQNADQRPWILANLALASYAKVGGTPWVVANAGKRRELVMGVSRVQDKDKKYVVGFVMLFNQDGDFLFWHSKTPVVEWDRYVEGLGEMVIEAFNEYARLYGVPESLVIHFHKRPGYRELEAVNRTLQRIGQNIPYALLHLNEYSNYRLFDTSHSTYVPLTGLEVDLGQRQALLLLDGREGDKRNRVGVPNVLEITMDRRSTMPFSEFPRLVRQIHHFAKVNWRGFNARSSPVTINYSYLISRLVLEIGINNWSPIIAAGKLRDKAWFL